jgi:hypothetical protein
MKRSVTMLQIRTLRTMQDGNLTALAQINSDTYILAEILATAILSEEISHFF